MEKQRSCITPEIINQSPEMIDGLSVALERFGISSTIPVEYDIKGYLSNIIGDVLELLHVETGRISLLLHVKAVVAVSCYYIFASFESFILTFSSSVRLKTIISFFHL